MSVHPNIRTTTRYPQQGELAETTTAAELKALEEGCAVVHLEHGIGRFEGLTQIQTGADDSEFLTLAYADDARLHVPVTSLHLVAHYPEPVPGAAPLDSLGAARWPTARNKAVVAVRDVAEKLFEARSRRAAATRDPYLVDNKALEAFFAGFPFELTPDQARASDAIVDDLANSIPMDRVVCGDVGFGKTELALRAAFLVASAGQQVAVLVPTTLLVAQHQAKFKERFSGTDLRIATLSRLDDEATQSGIIEELAAGEVDIVIGTHRLLGDDVSFSSLALAVIDEEHRFGVQQKEQFTAMRTAIDVLSLTATPIPRTLDAGLAGLRDVSVLRTPPNDRRAIATTVAVHDDSLVHEALKRELARNGQVFVLHNSIDSLAARAESLATLMDGARVRVGHGQMDEEALKALMDAFHAREFDVFVTTTIIENGLHVPNANTIVIESAEEFGLAQLHQLRGRVGRSDRDAYALLLTGPKDGLTHEACARLDAIKRFNSPGAGFDLARQDLEIRGAGELLGEDQSGRVADIGHALYSTLLAKAVRAIEYNAEVDPDNDGNGIEVDFCEPALLPETWIESAGDRLNAYVAIAGATSAKALHEVGVWLVERYGPLPVQAEHLLEMNRLRLRCERLGICALRIGKKDVHLAFDDSTAATSVELTKHRAEMPEPLKLDESGELVCDHGGNGLDDAIRFADRLLDDIKAAMPTATEIR